MENSTTKIYSLFNEVRIHTNKLTTNIPGILAQVKNELKIETLDGFEILKQAPTVYNDIDNKPLLVASLVGPSGAGKSTIFNLLTNIDVPAGGAVRPTSYGSIAAFPEEIYEKIDTHTFFPTFSTTEFAHPSDLKNKNIPTSQLFIAPYKNLNIDKDLWLCLVDIPDFNTTETSNWEKASQMINRADTVIFCVYHEAYKAKKTFDILKRCCKSSGNLIYLLTKLNKSAAKSAAEEIWNDIIASAKNDPDFSSKRADGSSLLSYLSTSSIYYSCYSETLLLDEIYPLKKDGHSFKSQLMGQKAASILLKRQLQTVSESLNSCTIICSVAKSKIQKINSIIQNVKDDVLEKSSMIVGDEFPVLHVLELIHQKLDENKPSLVKRLFSPLVAIKDAFSSVASTIYQIVKGIDKEDIKTEVVLREESEKKRLAIYSQELVDTWRKQIVDLELSADDCSKQLNKFLALSLPAADNEWEVFVQKEIDNWIENNHEKWLWAKVINEIILLIGSTVVVGDFFIGGGLGTFSVVATVGGSGVIGSVLLRIFTNLGLKKEINEIQKQWNTQRSDDYERHIIQNLANPLFLSKYNQIKSDSGECVLDELDETCIKLKEICEKYA